MSNTARLNQIPLHDFVKKLKNNPVRALGNTIQTGEENIGAQLSEMRQEQAEKRLLEYQINVKKGNINEFLLNKYFNGEYNQAIINGYDNSKNRIDNGISFEYHVYFSKNSKYDANRPHNAYWLSPEIINKNTGDSYYYHLPIHKKADEAKIGDFYTDLEEERVTNSGISVTKNGLVFALGELRDIIAKNGESNLDALAYSILKRHNFINVNGRIKFDIDNLLVEKYLKSIKSNTRHNALIYLNQEFKTVEDIAKVENYETTQAVIPVDEYKLDIELKKLNVEVDEIIKELLGDDKILSDDKDKLDNIKSDFIKVFEDDPKEFVNLKKNKDEFKKIVKPHIDESIEKYKTYIKDLSEKEKLKQEEIEQERLKKEEEDRIQEENRLKKEELDKADKELQDNFNNQVKSFKSIVTKAENLNIDIDSFKEKINKLDYKSDDNTEIFADAIVKINKLILEVKNDDLKMEDIETKGPYKIQEKITVKEKFSEDYINKLLKNTDYEFNFESGKGKRMHVFLLVPYSNSIKSDLYPMKFIGFKKTFTEIDPNFIYEIEKSNDLIVNPKKNTEISMTPYAYTFLTKFLNDHKHEKIYIDKYLTTEGKKSYEAYLKAQNENNNNSTD